MPGFRFNRMDIQIIEFASEARPERHWRFGPTPEA
jgi:hypothetical protein